MYYVLLMEINVTLASRSTCRDLFYTAAYSLSSKAFGLFSEPKAKETTKPRKIKVIGEMMFLVVYV